MIETFARDYLSLLTGKYSGINLTRIDEFEEFYNKQILDSIIPFQRCAEFRDLILNSKILVDVGFGGGFPILPLAKISPDVQYLGLEARGKKASVVSSIASDLNIKNVKLYHQRLEEVMFDREVVITFKAVGKISEFLSMINSSEQLYVFFYKGPNYRELEDIDSIKTDWEMFLEFPYEVSGTDGRVLLGFKNRHVPRGTLKNKLKFSTLL